MSEQIRTVYRDIEIKYECDAFRAEGYRPKEKLSALHAAIDRHLDKPGAKNTFTPIPVFMLNREGLIRGTITAENEDGSLWFKSDSGKREKVTKFYFRFLYKDTPQVVALDEKLSALNKERGELMTKLEDFVLVFPTIQ